MTESFLSLKPVADPRDFVGRDAEIRWAAQHLGGATPENIGIFGTPRIGKSSLVAFLTYDDSQLRRRDEAGRQARQRGRGATAGPQARRRGRGAAAELSCPTAAQRMKRWAADEEWARRFLDDLTFVHVDLKSIDEPEPEAVWRLIYCQLAKKLRVTEPPASVGALHGRSKRDLKYDCLNALAEFLGAPPKERSRVILALDDVEIMLEHFEPDDWHHMRVLSTSQFRDHMAFVLTSVRPFWELWNRRFEGQEIPSPFASDLWDHELGLLTDEEARQWVTLAAQSTGTGWPGTPGHEDDTEFLLRQAGRHPSLLKVAFRFLTEERRAAGLTRGDRVPRPIYEAVEQKLRASGQVKWLFDALDGVARRSPTWERAVNAVALGAPPSELAHMSEDLRVLECIGIVETAGGTARLFADSYRDHVRSRLRRQDRPPAAVAPQPGLAYIEERRQVRVDGTAIDLTPLEGRLVRYMMSRAGLICTHEDLLQNAWRGERSTAVVEKALNRLRAKIEPDPAKPRFIITIRGRGYLLDPSGTGQ